MAVLKVNGNSEALEVKNVYCIGKNYPDHIKEMTIPGLDNSVPKTPVIFLKPSTAIENVNNTVSIPEFNGTPISNDLQNEVELVIIVGRDGDNIPEEKAMEYIYGYAVGIDFYTARSADRNEKTGQAMGSCKRFQNIITGFGSYESGKYCRPAIFIH